MSPSAELDELAARFNSRQRAALSRLITLADNGELSPTFRESLVAAKSTCLKVGVTGPGGAGKSTLGSCFIRHLRGLGKSVAVVACDPSSPLTGGALLGDRVRMEIDPGDEAVFVRSISSRGAAGGISDSIAEILDLVARFGFDVVLVETVGAGQDQVVVRAFVDVLLLVVTPAAGDEIQWEKAGLLEAVDVVAVNKADLPGADGVCAGLRSMLDLGSSGGNLPPVPILKVIASRCLGVAELWNAIAAVEAKSNPRRRRMLSDAFLSSLRQDLTRRFRLLARDDAEFKSLLGELADNRKSMSDALREAIRFLYRDESA